MRLAVGGTDQQIFFHEYGDETWLSATLESLQAPLTNVHYFPGGQQF